MLTLSLLFFGILCTVEFSSSHSAARSEVLLLAQALLPSSVICESKGHEPAVIYRCFITGTNRSRSIAERRNIRHTTDVILPYARVI